MVNNTSYSDISSWGRSYGILYMGNETVQERGFKVGDEVSVGGDYQENMGIIVELSIRSPYEARVQLDRPNGSSVTCWIESQYLSLKQQDKTAKRKLEFPE